MARCVPHSEHFQAQNAAKTAPPDDRLQEGPPVKKPAVAVAVFVFAALMVLPIMRSVNLSAGKPDTIDPNLTADGWPLPWPGPPVAQDSTSLTADAVAV
jgi:hypothetical protein